MKDLFEVKFETKVTVGAASPKLAEPVAKAVASIWNDYEPYVKRVVKKMVQDIEKDDSDE